MALVTDLIAGWICDEASGNLADVLGSKTMSANGSPGTAAGKIGNSVTSPTTADFFAYSGLLFNSAPWSIAGWFYAPSLPGGNTAIFCQTNGTFLYNGFLLSSTGAVIFRFHNNTSLSLGGVSAATWFHAAGTHDGTTARLYIDGAYKGSSTSPAAYPPATPQVRILASPSAGAAGDFRADEIYAWSKVLADGGVAEDDPAGGEIAELWNGGAGLTYASFPAAGNRRRRSLIALAG